MSPHTWYVELHTWHQCPRMDDRRNKELFAKTLSLLEAAGRLTVRAAAVQPTSVRLVIVTDRDGPAMAADLATTTERLMQLACRTSGQPFWDEHVRCRPSNGVESEGLSLTAGGRRGPCRGRSDTVFSSLI